MSLLGGCKYEIYNMTTCHVVNLYLHPPSKFKIYNMTSGTYLLRRQMAILYPHFIYIFKLNTENCKFHDPDPQGRSWDLTIKSQATGIINFSSNVRLIKFYSVSAISQPCNGGNKRKSPNISPTYMYILDICRYR